MTNLRYPLGQLPLHSTPRSYSFCCLVKVVEIATTRLGLFLIRASPADYYCLEFVGSLLGANHAIIIK